MAELRPRTKRFAVAIFRFCDALPDKPSVQVIRRQLMRSASSIGANYRAACHARSRAEFLSKMSVAEEEADETEYWLELLDDLDHVPEAPLRTLQDEANEITSMIIASIKTARQEQ
ncbi:MAG: four helix bundle protein [Salinibacter sp.]